MTGYDVADMRLLLLAVLSVGCTAAPQRSQVLDSPVVPFDELFAPADTFRLDPSIIIGGILFLDVNQEGDFLVTDYIARSVDLFSSSGEHIRTYSARECLPDAENLMPYSSRFFGKGHVVTKHSGRAVVVFTADGRCVGATRSLPHPSNGFCASGDSLFFFVTPYSARASSHNSVVVYSPELHRLREIPVEWPKFLRLNANFAGIWERNIDCFGDGPYYTYQENMDAIPARFDAELAQQRPKFYSERPQDIPRDISTEARMAEWTKYLTTAGVFALNGHTRMVMYAHLDDRWQPEGVEDARFRLGISVASNDGRFPPRSTITSITPTAAGYGYTYSLGDHEPLPDGNVGNPLILRYRFIPPQDSDD